MMKATQNLRHLSVARLSAVLLVLPLALSTTGCSSTGRLALSLGLHSQTLPAGHSDAPRTVRFASMPQFESHAHRHPIRPLLVETAHHKQRNDLRADRLTDMKLGVATDAFTPVNGESTNN